MTRPISMTLGAMLLAAAGCLLAGCSSGSPRTLLAPGLNPPVADVPIPDGFHIQLSHSSFTLIPGSNLRLVNQVYKGSDPRLSVARFYSHYMPTDGWALQQETQGPAGIVESFSKPPESCTVTIKHSWFHTYVYLVIAPTSSTAGDGAANTLSPLGSPSPNAAPATAPATTMP